jgi:hypothetical protein
MLTSNALAMEVTLLLYDFYAVCQQRLAPLAVIFCPSKQLEDRSNVCFSLTFVQRVDHDNTR